MASGFFQGGMAEGIQSANKMDLANRTLAADTDLRTRGLEIKERTLQRAERQDILTRVDKAVSDTMATVNETIKAAVEAGRSPDQILKAVTPLVESAKALGAKAGRDPSLFDAQVKAWISQPGLIESAGAEGTAAGIKKATAAIAEARALQRAGVEDPTAGFKDKDQKIKAEGSLRDDYLKASQDFIKIRDAKNRLDAIEDTGAGDVALIFQFMKILDPGSTVREGEFATAESTAGVPGWVRAQYNKALSGERLTPEQRKAFKSQAAKLFQAQATQQDRLTTQFANIAKKNKLDVDSVIVDLTPAKPRVTDGASFSDRFDAGSAPGSTKIPPPPPGFNLVK